MNFPEGAITTQDYATAKPFPCAILDGTRLFDASLLENALGDAAGLVGSEHAYRYENPLELKYVVEPLGQRPFLKQLVGKLCATDWLKFLTDLTGIGPLVPDELLYGGGLSIVPPGGYLGLHRDLELHPANRLERRINVALFLNSEWHDEWGGHLEFWSQANGRPKELVRRIRPRFGRIVLFDPQGLHGFQPTTCPPGVYRLSLQLFYYTQPRPAAQRTRAWFTLRPGDDCEAMINDFRLAVRRTS